MKRQLRHSLILVVAAIAPLFGANNILVCPNTNYATIQGGVDAATPGSRIRVCAGTYAEQVNIAKNDLTLEAQGTVNIIPPAAMSGPSYGFTISAPNTQITGFTIAGFNNSLSAGIYVNRVNSTQLVNNLIYGNCNGVFLNAAINSSLIGNNISQNPFPPANAVVPQRGIPPPTPEPFCQPGNASTPGPDGFGIKSMGGSGNQIVRGDIEQNGQSGVQFTNDMGGSGVSQSQLFANVGNQGGSTFGNIDIRYSSGASRSISIENNTVDRGTLGINILNSDHVEVNRNRITNIGSIALNLMDSNRNAISHNDIVQNVSGISTAIFLSGEYNGVDHNNITNNDFGLFVYTDICPGTFGNQFSHNKIQNNPQGDVADSSYPTSCTPPPPANYTPFTYNFYDHNKCDVSTPSDICDGR